MYKVRVTRNILSPKKDFTVGKTFELPFPPFPGLQLIYRTDKKIYGVYLDDCEIAWDTDVRMFFVKLPAEFYDSNDEAEEYKELYQSMGWEVR